MSKLVDKHSKNINCTELHWLSQSGSKPLPYRGAYQKLNDDFQFLLERDSIGRIQMRRVGMFVEGLFGGTLVGREFSQLFEPERRDELAVELNAVFSVPAKTFVQAMADGDEIEFGIFPVSSDYGPVDFAVGAINLEEMPQKRITHLSLANVNKIPLFEEKKELRYGFAEGRSGFSGAPRANFKLIQGGGEGGKPAALDLNVIQNVKREP